MRRPPHQVAALMRRMAEEVSRRGVSDELIDDAATLMQRFLDEIKEQER